MRPSMYPSRVERGVRSSWETSAMNSLLRRSAASRSAAMALKLSESAPSSSFSRTGTRSS
jgi:hypothetical protein